MNDRLSSMTKALSDAMTALDRYAAALSSGAEGSDIFAGTNRSEFPGVYYAHTSKLREAWETIRENALYIGEMVRKTDQAGLEDQRMAWEQLFECFLALEAALMTFSRQAETAIHDPNTPWTRSDSLRSARALKLSLEALLNQIRAFTGQTA